MKKSRNKTKQNKTQRKRNVYLRSMIIYMIFVSKRCTCRWFRTRRSNSRWIVRDTLSPSWFTFYWVAGEGGDHIIQPFTLLFWGFSIVYVLLLCLYLDHLCVWKTYSHIKAVLPHMYSSGLTVNLLLLNRGIFQHILYLPCIDDWWGLCRFS